MERGWLYSYRCVRASPVIRCCQLRTIREARQQLQQPTLPVADGCGVAKCWFVLVGRISGAGVGGSGGVRRSGDTCGCRVGGGG